MTNPQRSIFDPYKTVMVDPWAVNPLLDDASQAIPATVAAAVAGNGDAPTMFESGDLPPFLASGVDPQVLMRLPYQVRHLAASEPSAAQVLALVEKYSNHDDIIGEPASAGLGAYIGRFRDWLAGKWTNPNFHGADAQQVAAADDALFNTVFAAQNAALNERIAAVNAANPPRPRTASDIQAWNERIGRAQR